MFNYTFVAFEVIKRAELDQIVGRETGNKLKTNSVMMKIVSVKVFFVLNFIEISFEDN